MSSFTRCKQGAVELVQGDEPLNADHVPKVLTLLQACAERSQPRVVLDLERVPLVDSAGLEMLLDIQEEFQSRGGCLKLACRGSLCREILAVTGVGRSFEVFGDAAAAVASFVQ